MKSKIQFLLFFPAFLLLYFAGKTGNIALGVAGTTIVAANAIFALLPEKKNKRKKES